MPELPEVESICRMLQDRIVEKTVKSVEVQLPRIIRRGAFSELVGLKFLEVYRRGKFICFDIEDNLRMFAHLRMTGTFLWDRDLEARPSHVRAEINFEEGSLCYRDVRTFGGIWIAEEGWLPWKKLGVDPIRDEFHTEQFKEMLDRRKISIKQALLDQSIIAGIGNIYASEALFEAGIHPARISNSLTLAETDRLRNAVRRILTAAIEAGGTTFRNFQLSDGKEGEFQEFLQIYGKRDQPCNHCSTIIQRIVQGQRSTFFCPTCQQL